MKSLKTILPISAGVVGIVAFWLAPNINKAKTVPYEEKETKTATKTSVVVTPTTTKELAKTKEAKTVKEEPKKLPTAATKKIKEQSTKMKRTKKIDYEMFSRRMPAPYDENEVILDSLTSDTTVLVP